LEDRTGKAVWRGTDICEYSPPVTLIGSWSFWIESDELAALHPFFLQKFELPLDDDLDEEIY
jgi:hypothetical protein